MTKKQRTASRNITISLTLPIEMHIKLKKLSDRSGFNIRMQMLFIIGQYLQENAQK